jgi:hypothetical protein
MAYKPLTKEEFDKLTLKERMDYLAQTMSDLREKFDETREQVDAAKESTFMKDLGILH